MKIRVFISIPMKDPLALRPVVSDLKIMDNVRASPFDQMHITLRFIGDIDDKKVKKIAKCVSDAVVGVSPFEISVCGAGCFPNAKRPSVIWIGAHPEETLTSIANKISDNLRSEGIEFDEKPFKSHITVGRCKGPVQLESFLEKYRDVEFQRFVCDEIKVMRSELSPSGAKHTVLESIPLNNSG